MKQSETVNKLIPALIKAQAEIKHSEKDGKNPHYRSEYSTLTSVIDACKEPLRKNGLIVIQTPVYNELGVQLETTIYHESGEFISSELFVPAPADAQKFGSALTYARRYSLSTIVGIAPEDDDGEGAKKPENKVEQKPKVTQTNYKQFFMSLPLDLQDHMRKFTGKGEAFAFAEKNGFDPAKMLAAIPKGTFAEQMADAGIEGEKVPTDSELEKAFGV